jgi:glycerol-1-phosphate dehydrogenase [NAD(P)+]
LLDWKLARDRLGEEYDEQTVKKSYELIERLLRASEDISSVTENGIRTMIEIGMAFFRLHRPYEEKNKLWPDQGVEHVFFYSLEKLTGRSFIHGEVVGMGCVVGSYLHRADVSKTIRELDSLGLRFRPAEIGISRDEFAAALQTMNKISHEAGFQYLILDEFELDQSDIGELWKILS